MSLYLNSSGTGFIRAVEPIVPNDWIGKHSVNGFSKSNTGELFQNVVPFHRVLMPCTTKGDPLYKVCRSTESKKIRFVVCRDDGSCFLPEEYRIMFFRRLNELYNEVIYHKDIVYVINNIWDSHDKYSIFEKVVKQPTKKYFECVGNVVLTF